MNATEDDSKYRFGRNAGWLILTFWAMSWSFDLVYQLINQVPFANVIATIMSVSVLFLSLLLYYRLFLRDDESEKTEKG